MGYCDGREIRDAGEEEDRHGDGHDACLALATHAHFGTARHVKDDEADPVNKECRNRQRESAVVLRLIEAVASKNHVASISTLARERRSKSTPFIDPIGKASLDPTQKVMYPDLPR